MKKIFCFVVLVALCGCASITYDTPDGGKITYKRLGGQKLDGLEVSKTKAGIVKLNLNKSQGDMGQMADVMVRLADMAAKSQSVK